MQTFWSSLLSIYGNIPESFYFHLSSICGSVVGALLDRPKGFYNWVTFILVGYLVSNYLYKVFPYAQNMPEPAARFLVGLGGVWIGTKAKNFFKGKSKKPGNDPLN